MPCSEGGLDGTLHGPGIEPERGTTNLVIETSSLIPRHDWIKKVMKLIASLQPAASRASE